MSTTNTVEMESLKGKLKATWMAGNYDYFSRFMESSAVQFLARLPLRPGDRMLDVACGSGQLALISDRIVGSVQICHSRHRGLSISVRP